MTIEKDFEKINFKLTSDGIMHIFLKDAASLISIEDWEESMEWIVSLGENRYLNLVEGNLNSADAIVREKAASSEENKYTIADAFVVKNISDKMISDFYLKFNKPCKPTRIFEDKEEAIKWLLLQNK